MTNIQPTPPTGKISAGSSKAAAHRPELTGVYPHARWRRLRSFECDAPRNAYQSARADLARLGTAAVLERHERTSRHTHARRWSPTDRATHDELVARCWGVAEVSRLRMVGLPRWVEPLLSKTSPTGRRMARLGWRPILALVIAAFRGGAAGVRLTFDELAGEVGPSRATCVRYVPEMIEAGLLTRINVGREVVGGKMNRANDSNVYQPGPVILANWHAVLEGCSSRVQSGGPNAKRARFAAHELRQDAREFRRGREIAARDSHPSPELPGRLRRPDVEGHEAEGYDTPGQWKPRPPSPFAPGELDELDRKLARESAELEARRASVGAAEDSEPAALAEGRAPAGAASGLSRSNAQSKLTTRSRSKPRDISGPKGPRPSASAAGSELEAAPTLDRCAVCRGNSESDQGRGSRCSHSFDGDQREPWPLASASGVPRSAPAIPNTEPTADDVAGHPLGVAPPAPQTKPEPPQLPIRGDNPRATTPEDEGAPPSTGANYDWRAGLREHVLRGGSLRFLDPKLRAELGFDPEE